MARTTWLRPLTLLLAAGLVAATASIGVAAEETAKFAGKPIAGGVSMQDATKVDPGVYTVLAPEAGEQVFFDVKRTMSGSTIWYGASVDYPEGVKGNLLLQAYADGDSTESCDRDYFVGDFEELRLRTSVYTTATNSACQSADSVVLSLGAYQTEFKEDDDRPVVQLVVWEEPPVEDANSMPAATSAVSWQEMPEPGTPKEAVAGTSYSDAPLLKDDEPVTITAMPGQPTLFRVPLDWGEHAQVVASSPTAAVGDDTATIEADWISPLGGAAPAAASSGGPSPQLDLSTDLETEPAGWTSPIVAWRNRQLTAEDGSPLALAGDYFLSIKVPYANLPRSGVEIILQKKTFDDYTDTPPTYTEDPTPLPELTTGASPASEEDEKPWPTVLMLLGGATVFTVAGLVGLGVGRKGRA